MSNVLRPNIQSAEVEPHRSLRLDVQGMRAVAVVLVVAYHAGLPVSGGFVGVDLFFVISGFVISRLLVVELERTSRIDFRVFYARRVRRLLPALAVVLIVTLLASVALLSPLGSEQTASLTALATSAFSANVALFLQPTGYFAAPAAENPFLHMWSLAVEEQFYLVFPAILLLAWRWRRPGRSGSLSRKRVAVIAVLVLALLSLAVSLYLSYNDGFPFKAHNSALAFYGSPSRAWQFASGAVVALLESRLRLLTSRSATVVGLVGVAALIISAFVLNASFAYPGVAAVLPTVSAIALLVAGSGTGNVVSAALGSKVPRWVGGLSYGWYLWHWPSIVFTTLLTPRELWLAPALAGLLALVPAWLSKRFVEDPIRFDRRLVGPRLVGLGVVCALVPAMLGGGSYLAAQVASPEIRSVRAQQVEHLDASEGCTQNLPTDSSTAADCTWPRNSSIDSNSIVLLGDSNAGQFAESLLPIAQDEGRSFTLATHSGCPFVNLELDPTPVGCRSFVQAWVDRLVKIRPSLVILASASSDYFIHSAPVKFSRPASNVEVSSDSEKLRLWQVGTKSILSRLAGANIKTLLVHTTPHFVDWQLDRCVGMQVWLDISSCGEVQSLSSVKSRQGPVAAAEDRAAYGLHDVSTLDLSGEICSDGLCATNDSDRWLYRDGGHITVGEARRLIPVFKRVLVSVGE